MFSLKSFLFRRIIASSEFVDSSGCESWVVAMVVTSFAIALKALRRWVVNLKAKEEVKCVDKNNYKEPKMKKKNVVRKTIERFKSTIYRLKKHPLGVAIGVAHEVVYQTTIAVAASQLPTAHPVNAR